MAGTPGRAIARVALRAARDGAGGHCGNFREINAIGLESAAGRP